MSLLALAVSGRGLVDPAAPVLRADDEGFSRGRAAFETLRVYGRRPFRLTEHLARLGHSAAAIGLPAPDPAEIEALARLAVG
jgi:branched-subunit amino acid aminotransferase/4-amino-4-deoxychorismate lyase